MRPCMYICGICNKRYKSQSGLKRHRKNCTQPTRDGIVDITSPMEDTSVENNQQQITSRFKWGDTKKINLWRCTTQFSGERISSCFHPVNLESSTLKKQHDSLILGYIIRLYKMLHSKRSRSWWICLSRNRPEAQSQKII